MDHELIEGKIKEILIKRLHLKISPEKVKSDVPLARGLGFDSVTLLELVVALEDEFEIMIQDGDIGPELFQDINSIANFLKKKLAKEAK
ncbi:MAG TPA: phosphopantetheine-binding protein [Thermodesulfobacteriota bacterium]|nr:phosphopantetheine-binding protein [Thermodesulfobacteriota bacterium]